MGKAIYNPPPIPPDESPSWGIYIERTANGFIASGNDGASVFEEPENSPHEKDPYTVARLLNHVIEYFNMRGDPFGPECVSVAIGPGDEHEGAKRKTPKRKPN
jgi:hypothetical protein